MVNSAKSHAADRLLDAMDRVHAPVCVGIDPVLDRLPRTIDSAHPAQAIRSFTLGVLDAVAGIVPCVKFQSACFERYRAEGVRVLEEMISEAKSRDLEVILDAKRGDIGITAEHYAAAAFGETSKRRNVETSKGLPSTQHPAPSTSDWLTINSYLGSDGIEPFLIDGHGAFALVRTSNPGGDAVQSLQLADGHTVAEAVARMVAQLGARSIGERGYSSLGAVVGATKHEDAARLRSLMPQQIFLVPGYGAQGGSANDVLPCFQRDESGRLSGAIVTASRSVIYAFQPDDSDWTAAVREAASQLAEEIGSITGAR